MSPVLDAIPLWALPVLTTLVTLLVIEAGYRLGAWRRRQSDEEKEAPVGTAVAAALGLLAFLLAFTFGLAASRFEARRTVLIDEANAVGTAYLRAALLPEPHRTSVRRLLLEYVDVRLAAAEEGTVEPSASRSEELHNQLWSEVVAVAELDPRSVPTGLFIESINDLIDLHTVRLTAAVRSRIPGTIWAALFSVAAVTFWAMGYYSGLTRTRRSLSSLAVVLSFVITIWLIADLDRPQQGLIRVSQQAIIDLRNSMRPEGGI